MILREYAHVAYRAAPAVATTSIGNQTRPTDPRWTSSDVTLDLPLPAPGNYAAMDISVQANDGPPTHSGTSLAGASFT